MDFWYTSFLPLLFSHIGSEVQRSKKPCPSHTAVGWEQSDHTSLSGATHLMDDLRTHGCRGYPPVTQLLWVQPLRMLSVQFFIIMTTMYNLLFAHLFVLYLSLSLKYWLHMSGAMAVLWQFFLSHLDSSYQSSKFSLNITLSGKPSLISSARARTASLLLL